MRHVADKAIFIPAWNSAVSADEAASKVGITRKQAITLANNLRRRGEPVKKFTGDPQFIKCAVCGKPFRIYPCDIRKGTKRYCSVKCAATKVSARFKTHGQSKSRLHGIWCHMKTRCYCETTKPFFYYGARGIGVCKEWRNNFEAFQDWALANGYHPELELDRRDTNGDYEPSNCRWANRVQQMRNTRKRHQRNRTSRFKGVARCTQSKTRPWRAAITIDKKPIHLGVFKTEIEAAEAYDRAALERFGEFAHLNFSRKECVQS